MQFIGHLEPMPAMEALNQGSAAGKVQRAEFAVPSDMRKSHVALAGLKH